LARRGSSHEITLSPNRAAALPRRVGGPWSCVAIPQPERGGKAGPAVEADRSGKAAAGRIRFSKRHGTAFASIPLEGVPYSG
jgi:hypothetical protein